MNTDYERDVRNTDPNQDNRRLGAFKKGWNTFVDGEDMTSETLKSLTFEKSRLSHGSVE